MNKEEFKKAKIEDTEKGLMYEKLCLMYKWEKPFIKEGARLICKQIKPESVIEIGFGYGYTADTFQDAGVKTHIIIEANKQIYDDAVEWAKKRAEKYGMVKGSKLEIIYGYWQDVKDLTETFDLLYYDPYEIIRGDTNTEQYNYKYRAYMFMEQEAKDGGFWFEKEGKKYFQPLQKL